MRRAGVSGLTAAFTSSKNKNYSITVAAKHMPGDYDIEYASPWAGANYLPVGKEGTPSQEYERNTWPELAKLAEQHPEAGIHFQGELRDKKHKRENAELSPADTLIYRREKDKGPVSEWFAELIREDAWFSKVVPNFKVLSKEELPEGMDGGTSFTSVCINTAIYLPWLVSQCLKNGVIFKRGVVKHIADATSLHHSGQKADLVVNCTGLFSLFMEGVQDKNMYPARGQIVLVRNDPGYMATTSGTDDGDDEAVYIMHRAAGGGCILGGCLQADRWDSAVDPNLATRIMKRAIALTPSLVPEGKGIEALDIIRHGVGLRPMRKGGIRTERETIKSPDGNGIKVVHSIGHGGYGYQTSWGCAAAVVKLVEESLAERARL
ncbi:FAD dependent oxidoreductase [Aureobasidium pullulans]|uniref:D-amino-acid oxidase n=1 Tax=Aureobasidium pullulans TaxID=5580 RepID=A0A4S8SRD0_AURPU|nr:FAD dependent oxidoreductase [Aureobasidium pullulans]